MAERWSVLRTKRGSTYACCRLSAARRSAAIAVWLPSTTTKPSRKGTAVTTVQNLDASCVQRSHGFLTPADCIRLTGDRPCREQVERFADRQARWHISGTVCPLE